jgi:hypothetical protein
MNTVQAALTMGNIISELDAIQQKGSFDKDYYPVIDTMVAAIGDLKRKGIISDEDITEIRHFFGQDFLENTLHGMALLKKYGYAGDFLMIDKIYTGNTPKNPFFQS